jgi:hypothetical protein
MISNMLPPGPGRTTCRKLNWQIAEPFLMKLLTLEDSSVSIRGTEAAEWDRNTWAPLEDLARNHPEAGVHFQGMMA